MTDSKSDAKRDAKPDTAGVSRRGFLLAITGSAIAAAAGCRPDGMIVPTVYAPGSAPTNTPAPNATPIPTLNAQAAPRDLEFGKLTYDQTVITDVADLYITQYNYSNTPRINAENWTLVVDGLVESPLELNLDGIKALPAHEDMRVLECISNPVGGSLIGNLTWKGVLIEEILSRVKVKPEATHARFYAKDGYETSVKLDWITNPGTMLAYEMNGEPLTVEHGFPLRIHMPGLYGQKMPRWLTRIEFIDYDFIGIWEGRGWSNTADVRTKSILRSPRSDATPQAGHIVVLQGVAVAGKRAITSVEVQIDGGAWMPTTLRPHEKDPLSWTQWYFEWLIPAPGTYQIGVRATDDTGFVQTSEATGVFGGAFPNGTDAVHRLTITAV